MLRKTKKDGKGGLPNTDIADKREAGGQILTLLTKGVRGSLWATIRLFRNRLKYNVKILKNYFSKTMSKFSKQKCRDKRILPKCFDLFDKNVQKKMLSRSLERAKVVDFDQELGLRWRACLILSSLYLQMECL